MKRIEKNSYLMEGKVDVVKGFEKSETQQHLKEEVDVNHIVARALRTGILGDPLAIGRREGIFADVSAVGDFHSSLRRIDAAKEAFMELPADLRKRFNHDPANLLAFLADPANKEEAVKLGLVKPDPVKEVPSVASVPPVA